MMILRMVKLLVRLRIKDMWKWFDHSWETERMFMSRLTKPIVGPLRQDMWIGGGSVVVEERCTCEGEELRGICAAGYQIPQH